jgi:hypothetical protein
MSVAIRHAEHSLHQKFEPANWGWGCPLHPETCASHGQRPLSLRPNVLVAPVIIGPAQIGLFTSPVRLRF